MPATVGLTQDGNAALEDLLYTCMSCSIAFPSAEDQRVHYRSDHHRYNMKRRVASLAPVSAAVFNQKVLDRKAETAIMANLKGSVCEICGKTYTTENAYRSHLNSKKHKENELKAIAKPNTSAEPIPVTDEPDILASNPAESSSAPSPAPAGQKPEPTPAPASTGVALTVSTDADEDEVEQTIDAKIAAARARLSPLHCLFCTSTSDSLADNLTHMSVTHSFFIPEADYLVDLPGLISYLGEKIAVGNVCIYCNGRGRDFRTLDAVRKHMVDKGHCKIAYESERDQLELSDYYDFSTSYPDAGTRKKKEKKAKAGTEGQEWEDVSGSDDEEADEVIDESASDEESDEDDSSEEESDEEVPENVLAYGDSHLELVLPSSFPSRRGKVEDPNSGAALVRQLLADKNSALVPRKGGYGAFGTGTEVVKARNRGEAREAGRHVREFRDIKRKEDYKTRVGFTHNHQKHYRDPLLQ